MKSATWETLLADRSLRDLPYKIETNRFDKIIMSPASNWHSALSAPQPIPASHLCPGFPGRIVLD